jgi:hypothetical protein
VAYHLINKNCTLGRIYWGTENRQQKPVIIPGIMTFSGISNQEFGFQLFKMSALVTKFAYPTTQ